MRVLVFVNVPVSAPLLGRTSRSVIFARCAFFHLVSQLLSLAESENLSFEDVVRPRSALFSDPLCLVRLLPSSPLSVVSASLHALIHPTSATRRSIRSRELPRASSPRRRLRERFFARRRPRSPRPHPSRFHLAAPRASAAFDARALNARSFVVRASRDGRARRARARGGVGRKTTRKTNRRLCVLFGQNAPMSVARAVATRRCVRGVARACGARSDFDRGVKLRPGEGAVGGKG